MDYFLYLSLHIILLTIPFLNEKAIRNAPTYIMHLIPCLFLRWIYLILIAHWFMITKLEETSVQLPNLLDNTICPFSTHTKSYFHRSVLPKYKIRTIIVVSWTRFSPPHHSPGSVWRLQQVYLHLILKIPKVASISFLPFTQYFSMNVF